MEWSGTSGPEPQLAKHVVCVCACVEVGVSTCRRTGNNTWGGLQRNLEHLSVCAAYYVSIDVLLTKSLALCQSRDSIFMGVCACISVCWRCRHTAGTES